MRIFRFRARGEIFYGALEGKILRELRGNIFEGPEEGQRTFSLAEVEVLPPVEPSKIICLAYNFPSLAKERGIKLPQEPVFFFKPPSSLTGHLKPVLFPPEAEALIFQGELAMVVGKRARKVKAEEAEKFIFGFTAVNDITAVFPGLHPRSVRAKAYDTFTPAGPCLLRTWGEKNFKLKTFVNAKLRQAASTSRMRFTPSAVLWYLSRVMTLEPGDLVCLGTPEGAGKTKPGDRVDVQIEGIGTLSNLIIKEGTHEDIP